MLYLHPILEYTSTVWSPCTKSNIHKLNRAARFMMHNYSSWASVTEMLHNLNLPTLEQRRNTLKLILTYKIVHNQVQVESRILIRMASHTRDHDQCFLQGELTHIFTLFIHPQLNCGMTYPAVLLNPPQLIYLNN